MTDKEFPIRPVKIWDRLFYKKPRVVFDAEELTQQIPRYLTLFDLLCIGIGTTVGTGIFSSAGQIINESAGPGAALSWIIAGFACCLSGVAYMEMSSLIPSSGSCYAYAYHTLGELPAFIAATLLTLEYAISGAGVARSWASKVQEWAECLDAGSDYSWLNQEHLNLMGFLVHFLCVVVLLCGRQIGKKFINYFTVGKVSLMLFMIIAGFAAIDYDNLSPFLPKSEDGKYGIRGVMMGASQCFFGYVGFDEVCCMAVEAKNSRKIMPVAVLGVIIGTCLLSTLASLSLAGIQPYDEITAGFGGAFRSKGWVVIQHIVQAGEIITLPLVVLVCLLAQPRLHYGLAVDGLMPKAFLAVNANGQLFWNTLVTGIFYSLITLAVPFEEIWHLVDFGVLISFNITSTTLIINRGKGKLEGLTMWMSGFLLSSMMALMITQKACVEESCTWPIMTLIGALGTGAAWSFCYVVYLFRDAPADDGKGYRVPLVPFIPCLSILVNWYLVAQLENKSIVYGILYILAGVVLYLLYGYNHSVGQKTGWQETLDKGYTRYQDSDAEFELTIPKKVTMEG